MAKHSSKSVAESITCPSDTSATVIYAIPANCSSLSLSNQVSALQNVTAYGLSSSASVPLSYITVAAVVNTCWQGQSGRRKGSRLLAAEGDQEPEDLRRVSNRLLAGDSSGSISIYMTITWPPAVVAAGGITPSQV